MSYQPNQPRRAPFVDRSNPFVREALPIGTHAICLISQGGKHLRPGYSGCIYGRQRYFFGVPAVPISHQWIPENFLDLRMVYEDWFSAKTFVPPKLFPATANVFNLSPSPDFRSLFLTCTNKRTNKTVPRPSITSFYLLTPVEV